MELSSSDDEEIVSITNNENSTTGHHPECTSTPDTECSICLGDLINKCHSDSCEHLFCFVCLKRWLNTDPTCPLCKNVLIRIYHSFTEQGTHEAYDVPISVIQTKLRNEMLLWNSQTSINNSNDSVNIVKNFLVRISLGEASRTKVYVDNIWANPLPDSSGNSRDCSLEFYRNNPSQTNRLHDFILRDIIAVVYTITIRGSRRPIHALVDPFSLTQFIMRSILVYEMKKPYIMDVFQYFLGDYTRHFFHELYNYAYSPYDMIDYDRHVQYTLRNSIDTTSVSIIGHTNDLLSPLSGHLQLRSGPIPEFSPGPVINETSSLMDQPSTSTGIRDSLDRPNNRKQRLVSPTGNESTSTPEHVKRRTPILDSSSDDEL